LVAEGSHHVSYASHERIVLCRRLQCRLVAGSGAKAVENPPAAAAARPPRPVDPRYAEAPRARAPSLELALEAATAAVAKCKTMNHKITVQVTDGAGEPVVLLSGDGAGMRSLRLMKPKPFSVYRHKVASSKANELAKTDPVLADAIKGDTAIGYGGALPILVGDELIGVITVSGTPTGTLDEVCGQAGLDKIASRLK
jgi:uncharacterized protein GlcG (DUF336 family)